MITDNHNHPSQRGQALIEYMVLVPIAIMIVIAGSALVAWINQAFFTTYEGLEMTNVVEEVCEAPDIETEGPQHAQVDNHSVSLVSATYNPSTDETTVVYHVVSGCKPDISHWVLGIPQDVYNNIVDYSGEIPANFSFGNDGSTRNEYPPNGFRGLKFDSGYSAECTVDDTGGTGGSNNPPGQQNNPPGQQNNNDNTEGDGSNGGQQNNPPGQQNNPPGQQNNPPGQQNNPPGRSGSNDLPFSFAKSMSLPLSQSGGTNEASVEGSSSRDIALVLSGQYTFTSTTFIVKAGTNVVEGTISAPTLVTTTTNSSEGCADS